MKKKQKVQIFKLEERVLFDGAAAAEIAAAVDQAGEQNQDQNQADDHSDNSEQDKEQELIQKTVQNAGPVDTPEPDATVQNAGEGLPQADAAQNDPAEVLINGNADFTQVTDPQAEFSGDVAEFIQAADPDADAEAADHELIVIDSEAADRFDQDAFEGKNVLFLDADSEAADQIEDWMNEHSDQDISEVRLVTDSDTLASQIADIDHLEVTAVDVFQSELADADSGDLVIVPDPEANITVDAPADELPEELSNDAAEGRHELVIVNSTMADLDNVLDQLGDSREVLVIDVNADAFEQISDYLDNSDTAYDAVHILTHGNDQGFSLGHQKVIAADQMAVFNGHMAEHGDFLIYGCNLAASEQGQALIHNIADYTGCDVAASANITGAAALGGDWSLEYNSGAVETTAISLDSSWEHRLAQTVYTVDSSISEDNLKDLKFRSFDNAFTYAVDDSEAAIKIIKVSANDHGINSGAKTVTHNLEISIDQASVDEGVTFTWNIKNLTVTGTLTIFNIALETASNSEGRVNVDGGTVNFNNAVNNVNVYLTNSGSISVDGSSNVQFVDAAAGTSVTFVASTSSITTLDLEAGGSWTLNKGTIGTLFNYGDVNATGATFTTVSNYYQLNMEGGSADSLINHYSSLGLTIAGNAQITTLDSDSDVTMTGGSITTASQTGSTFTMTGGSIGSLTAYTATLSISQGTITSLTTYSTNLTITAGTRITDTLTHNSGDLTVTGGQISTLENNSTGTNTVSNANITNLNNYGEITVNAGTTISKVENYDNLTFAGGTVTSTVNNAENAAIDVTGDLTTGQITNSGELTIEATLSIPTLDAELAIDNKLTGKIIFKNGTLFNSLSDPVLGLHYGTGISNTDGGSVTSSDDPNDSNYGTIEGFSFAAMVLPGGEFNFNSVNNGVDGLASLVVRGGNADTTQGEFIYLNDALAYVIAASGSTAYSININLGLQVITDTDGDGIDEIIDDYSKWKDYLTITTVSGEITNLYNLKSSTYLNNVTVNQNVFLKTDIALDPDGNNKYFALENITFTIEDGGSLAVINGSTLKMSGTAQNVVSVSGLDTPFPAVTLGPGNSHIVNNGTLSIFGNDNGGGLEGAYLNLSGKLQSVINNGTMDIANAHYNLSVDVATGSLPDVDGIFNAGTLTISGSELTGTFLSGAATSALVRSSNTGTVTITDSTLNSNSSTGRNSFAIYNDGKLEITDSFINASGSSSFGLFNGVNGNATFTVTKLPDIYLSLFSGNDGSTTLREYVNQIYHIKGSAYSVYNEGIFKTVNDTESGTGYTISGGLLNGTLKNTDGVDVFFRDAPVYALIGNFQTMAVADNTVKTILKDITLDGSFASEGTARNDLTNLILNGNLDNTISEVYVAGAFMSSNFTVGDGTASYKGYYGSPNRYTAITITNHEGNTEGSRKGGAIYFGQNELSMVSFNPELDYIFYNLSGEMAFDYFGGLSSEKNPAQFYNRGVMTIDGTHAGGLVDGLYQLYVEQVSSYRDALFDYMVAEGIEDSGIVNFYANIYNVHSVIPNQLTLTNLNVRNTQDASAAVTNYAGNLTVNGGRLSGTFSGLDNMEVHYYKSPSNVYDFYMISPIATLNGVESVAGAAYSVRNDGDLTVIPKGDSKKTLFTNQLDFGTQYAGNYIAVSNVSLVAGIHEIDSSESKVYTRLYFEWNSVFGSKQYEIISSSEGSIIDDTSLYLLTPASTNVRTEIEKTPEWSQTYSEAKYTVTSYGPMLVKEAVASLDHVSFLAQSNPYENTAIFNRGKLTATDIDAVNKFNGFNFMLDVSGNEYGSIFEPYVTTSFFTSNYFNYSHGIYIPGLYTSKTDLEIGFSVSATTLKSTEQINWDVTVRGVKVDPDDPSDYHYDGSFDVNGSALSVSTWGKLTLVNFSVYAKNAANAIQVDASGLLHIYNGTYDDSTHQWIGGSNAVISSDGNANGIMLYGTMEMINGAITECVNGIVVSDTAGMMIVVNSTIAGNSGWGIVSDLKAPSGASEWNLGVFNTTVAYNGKGGIQLNNGGRLMMVNTISLNKNPDATSETSVDLVLNDDSTLTSSSDGNVYGKTAEETRSYMDSVYGFRDLPVTWADDGQYVIPQVENNEYAWKASVKWTYTAGSWSVIGDVTVGSGASDPYQVTYDKMGNNRTDPGGPIGSYVLSGSVGPTAILVTTLQDSNDIIVVGGTKLYSLRYVINYLLSNENTGADTEVAFDWAKLYAEAGDNPNLTITLDNALGSLNVKYVDSTTTPIDNLTIDLNAEGYEIPSGYKLNIDGSGLASSVFMVSGIALTVNGAGALTVTGSGNTADNGAAFNLADVEGTSLTLKNAAVTGGSTTGDGGAVYVGAVASLTAAGITFSGNSAANGGAIYNNGGTIKVEGTLSGNNTTAAGGAIYNNGGTITVSGTLSGNTATVNGGAIYSTNGMTVSGTVTGNSAANGGAVYNAAGTATISADLSNNTATADGGAVFNAGTATMTGTVTGNNALNGAGIYNTGTLTAGALSGNTAGAAGGALYNAGTATVNGDITGNSASEGAGVYSINNLTVNGNIANNTATGNGGALYNAGTAVITGDITENGAANGAGIYTTAGTVTLNGNLTDNTAAGEGAALYITGGKFGMNGDVKDNTGASIIYAKGGRAQFGSLDSYYVTMSGNTGILVNEKGGDVLIVNASITENDAGAESLFAISDGVFTTLNTTITANSGDVLDQAGGMVQIGDTTIYEPDGAVSFTGGDLYVLNSIVNVSNDFTVTNDEGSRINEVKSRIFVLKGGEPVSGPNGTLQIKLAGKAGRDGVMLGYTQDAVKTMLYYTSDGSTWHDAAGSVSAAAPAFEVEYSQNESERLYNGYAFLSIGAYSLKATELSLVVTISGDEPVDGETTLREALEYAEYLYLTEGTIATVTFLVSDVYLTSTITIDNPVTVSGGVTIHSTDLGPSPLTFAGDSVFVVNSADPEVKFQNLTIEGQTGVRGIRVDDGSVVLKNVTIENGQADGSKGSEAKGGAIYVTGGGSVIGTNVILRSNLAEDGAAIYSNGPVELDGFTVTGNVQTGAAGGVIHVTDAASTLLLRNGTLTGNDTAGSLIRTAGAAGLISVSAADNGVNDTVGSSLLKAASADIVNSTIAGNTADGSALVAVTDDLNAANSIIVTSRGSGQAVTAGSIKSAYSIYSGTLENVVVDVNNLTGSTFNALFSDNEGGRPMPREDSPAAVGVWTMYDPETREIAYSERPEDIWTVKYKPENMQWHILGGGLTSSNSAYLVSGSSSMPSIGANWIQGGQNHPDYGPGVNTDMINPSFTGDYGLYWDYNSLVSGYYMNPYSSLTLDSESGMGWYSSLLSDLFGIRSQQSRILSVTGGIPSDELELSVDADMEDFGEFQEAPYSAEDGTPLSQEELNAIRNAAVTGRMPDDSVHLDEAVHEKVAASLRSSELFKDRFDKALDALLGLDA